MEMPSKFLSFPATIESITAVSIFLSSFRMAIDVKGKWWRDSGLVAEFDANVSQGGRIETQSKIVDGLLWVDRRSVNSWFQLGRIGRELRSTLRDWNPPNETILRFIWIEMRAEGPRSALWLERRSWWIMIFMCQVWEEEEAEEVDEKGKIVDVWYHSGLGFLVGQFQFGKVDGFLHPVGAEVGRFVVDVNGVGGRAFRLPARDPPTLNVATPCNNGNVG